MRSATRRSRKKLYLKYLAKPQGMILVTGPTGSGKTVSLYTGLNILNKEDTNISTAEDPAEINLPGVNQVNVNPKVGLTFAAALRAFLRQDPDVVMVGEIRDLETAEIAIKAAQTGHLVLSTLHTNDAPQTLTRLIDMGVKPYAIATSVSPDHRAAPGAQAVQHLQEPVDVPAEALLKEGFSEEDVAAGMQALRPARAARAAPTATRAVSASTRSCRSPRTSAASSWKAATPSTSPTRPRRPRRLGPARAGLEKVKVGMTSLEEINSVTID
jgi:type IV pilus assembly protein PilB